MIKINPQYLARNSTSNLIFVFILLNYSWKIT